MIRFIIFAIYAIIMFAVCGLMLIILPIWGKIHKPSRDAFVRALVRWVYACVRFIAGVKTTVKGLENLPEAGEGVLYIGNHRSYFDILISYPYFKGRTGYVAKKEMNKVLILRRYMEYVDCLFLDRKDPKEGLKTILQAIEMVKNGTSIFIFPEGTRNSNDTMLDFKEGSFKIAQKSGCKIIPVVQCNGNALLEDHFPKFKSAHTIIEFGKPIDMKELDPEDRKHIGAYVQNVMQQMYDENLKLV